MLKIKNLSVCRGTLKILNKVNLNIDSNINTAIVGPSGCGKTTLFLAILGIVEPVEGKVAFKQKVFFDNHTKIPTEKRNLGIVFQDLALFPHMNVVENIKFGLNGTFIEDRVAFMIESFHLRGLESKTPFELSGGEKQRVALARSVAPNPDYLLLDETFSSLDPQLKLDLREELREILKKLKRGCLFISHDQEEVNEFADVVIKMERNGFIKESAV